MLRSRHLEAATHADCSIPDGAMRNPDLNRRLPGIAATVAVAALVIGSGAVINALNTGPGSEPSPESVAQPPTTVATRTETPQSSVSPEPAIPAEPPPLVEILSVTFLDGTRMDLEYLGGVPLMGNAIPGGRILATRTDGSVISPILRIGMSTRDEVLTETTTGSTETEVWLKTGPWELVMDFQYLVPPLSEVERGRFLSDWGVRRDENGYPILVLGPSLALDSGRYRGPTMDADPIRYRLGCSEPKGDAVNLAGKVVYVTPDVVEWCSEDQVMAWIPASYRRALEVAAAVTVIEVVSPRP
jgi:hypothetical protein